LLKIAYKNSDKNKIKYEDVVAASKHYSQPLDIYFNSSNTVPCVKQYNENCVLVRKTPFTKIVRYALQSKAKISQEAFNLVHKLAEIIFKQSLTRNTSRLKQKRRQTPSPSKSNKTFDIIPFQIKVDSGTQSDVVLSDSSTPQSNNVPPKVSVDSGTQSELGRHSDNVVLSDSGTQSDSEPDDDDNESILSNIIMDLQSKNVDLQKAVEEERIQKELYKEMYEILESEQDKDTQSKSDSVEIETQTDLTHDDISDNEHEAVWQKVKRLNDKNKWKNKLLDKDLEVQSNKLQNNIERIKL